ncbi:NHL repeat-containing protein [Sphingobacterium faecale]|uniref:DUF5018 domain-containing protein n=1 Tax=Sphingobacterium faecale TaxID=2803775 RepID=A0ABS1R515_9SPHI|nr:hypothetical protein [Sphingobacterium faecale]MBL1409806.1 hypothetical protein [Sphingobacterium faecale]
MKNLNKLTRYLMVAIIALGVTACSKKADDTPIKTDPKMLSFGFYAADNEDNLFRDYVVKEVTGNSIQIELPKEVDRTKLVARFTTTEKATVTLNGSPQQSGITKADFSTPADYIVTEGATNARYTVTIVNAADYVWTRVGAYTDKVASEFDMKVNPSNGVPYFFFMQASSDVELRKGFAAKYQDNSWAALGNEISAGRIGTNLSMTLDKDGQPYIVYQDYTAEKAQTPTIQRYNGTSWSLVGKKGIFNSTLSNLSIGINPANNQPILFTSLNVVAGGEALSKRALSVSLFSGSTWSIHNEVTNRPTGQATGSTSSKTVGETLYLIAFNSSGVQTYSVYTYKQGTWTTIIDKAIEPSAKNSLLSQVGIDVDHDGNIYIIVADDGQTNGTFNLRVKKYTPATQSWSQVGNVINTKASTYSLALSPAGTPYVLYRDDNGLPTVTAFNTDTQDWGTPKALDNVAAKSANVFIGFAANGTGYASYINSTDNIVLYKFDTPQ